MDMTHGPLLGKILLFSLPLMASNLLQLLFNTADIVVVGRWAGHQSLAAVGSTACVINLVINLLVGISVGSTWSSPDTSARRAGRRRLQMPSTPPCWWES